MQWLRSTLPLLLGGLSVVSCWQMAFRLGSAWWFPLIADNGTWIKFGIGVMVMEFVVVHSGGLLTGASISTASKKMRSAFLIALVVFYFGFAWLISSVFGNSSLFYSFAAIMFCRLITGFFAFSEKNSSAVVQRSVTSVALYLFVCFLSILVPFPAVGLTPRVLHQFYQDAGNGIWNREPQRALAAGMIYFFLMGLQELYTARDNMQKSKERRRSQAQFYGTNKI